MLCIEFGRCQRLVAQRVPSVGSYRFISLTIRHPGEISCSTVSDAGDGCSHVTHPNGKRESFSDGTTMTAAQKSPDQEGKRGQVPKPKGG